MNIPSLIVLIALVAGLFGSEALIVDLIFILPSFEAMAVLPPALLGGTSLTPGSMAAFFFILRAIMKPGLLQGLLAALVDFRRLGWLGLFFIVAAAGAVVLPHLFNGAIMVYGLRAPELGAVAPSMTNFTQTGYLFLSVAVAAIVCVRVAREPAFVDMLLKAILAGGYAVIATGLVDIAADAAGRDDMLVALFHTANYGYSAGEILGASRIMGLTPEPSAFGGLASSFCAMLLFLRPAYPRSLSRWKVPVAAWGCAAMAFLSTSSTAYASMFVILGLYLFYTIHAIAEDGTIIRRSAVRKAVWGTGLIFVLLVVALIDQRVIDYAANMVDTLIVKKQYTESYIERSSWTQAGMEAFAASLGLGVGVGSVRTSNFFVNLLASTGVPGTLLFFIFLAALYRRRAPQRGSREAVMITAAKLSLLPMFASLFLAGTVPDFGIVPGVLFGLIAGLAAPFTQTPRQPLVRSPHPPLSLAKR
ncbi:MAG: hypothetical protein KGI37_11095 [Alphaproteobacteria bacterium]|nr:hypothetical protein [Alphaproteobacteria bacterium]